MNPYAKPNERKIGTNRPRVIHSNDEVVHRTRQERQAEKRAVIDERRAIKKSARQQLNKEVREELDDLKE